MALMMTEPGSCMIDLDQTVHATCVSVRGVGVLLRGPSGSGKSDLALRLIDAGACLVADDRSTLSIRSNTIVARPPSSLAGLIEVRGIGIIPIPYETEVEVRLVADLVDPSAIERLPEPNQISLLGIPVVHIRLAPFEASAPAKLRLAASTAAAPINRSLVT